MPGAVLESAVLRVFVLDSPVSQGAVGAAISQSAKVEFR